jgi:hypothetical protein
MPELWFGPDGSLDLSALPDGDPSGILPILPGDELAALHEALALTGVGYRRVPPTWEPRRMGFADHHDDGDALAAAMGGVHHDDGPVGTPTPDLDDLIDPWAGGTDLYD